MESDIREASNAELLSWLDNGHILTNPIVIRSESPVENPAAALSEALTHLTSAGLEDEALRLANPTLDPQPVYLPYLPGFLVRPRPPFAVHPRFTCLDYLHELHPQPAAGPVAFPPTSLYSTTITGGIALKEPHVDLLDGSWFRVLSGGAEWSCALDLDDVEWSAFEREGFLWSMPLSKTATKTLRAGDAVFLPPGKRWVYMMLSHETCVTDGGMVWDWVTLGKTLGSVGWVAARRGLWDQPVPGEMEGWLGGLVEVLGSEEERSELGVWLGDGDAVRRVKELADRLRVTLGFGKEVVE